tara:strand:- start:149 stop:1252 length:1104 start_codon:yes stop_codon:yes gene_type:complete
MAVSRINEAGLNINQYGNRNIIINGKFEIDQRHLFSSHTVSQGGDFFADRWGFYTDSGAFAQYGATSQVVADGPTGFEKSLKWTTTSSGTIPATGEVLIRQVVEGYNINQVDYGSSGAKELTLSFYVKSSIAGNYGLTAQYTDSGGTNRYNLRSYTINSANTWELKTILIPANTANAFQQKTNGAGLRLNWDLGEGTSYSGSVTGNWQTTYVNGLTGGVKIADNNGATWQITGVQLEVGDTATEFEHRSYGDELAKCQRYFHSVTVGADNSPVAVGAYYTATSVYATVFFPVTMRTNPSIISSNTSGHFHIFRNGNVDAIDGWAGLQAAGLSHSTFYIASGPNSTTGSACWIETNSSDAITQFNAEL